MPSEGEDDAPTRPGSEPAGSEPDTSPDSRRPARRSASDRVSAARIDRPSGEDTLLSAPAPSDVNELNQERLADAERRLDDVEARLRALERFADGARNRNTPARWLGWVIFLLALAVAWLFWRSRAR
jgi:hypothetical protein